MIKHRRYKALIDFPKVLQFLTMTYDITHLNSALLPQYFEYGHTHRLFNHALTHHIGLWEDNNLIVGIACYGMYPGGYPGQCHLHTMNHYEYLLPEMLHWAQQELFEVKNNTKTLACWVVDTEVNKKELFQKNGYTFYERKPIKVYDYTKTFSDTTLPGGFRFIDGTCVDYEKLNTCFWLGFEGIPDPDNQYDCRLHMWNAPNIRLELNTIIVAPDGEYAAALGMWFDKHNKYAYLEPLCSIPKYKGMGLGKMALFEAMKKTKRLGAAYCFGASSEFYTAIGFDTIAHRELWIKSF